MKLARALVAEILGTAFLLATVVGSGILAHHLDLGNLALTVLCIAFATGGVLAALISAFSSVSAHFNPIVTVVLALRKEFSWKYVLPYIVAQICGAILGVMVANLMFDLPALVISTTARTGAGQWLGEAVATFGLIGVIIGCSRGNARAIPYAVAAYVAGAIYFTSSTCFANPAVTIARMFTDTLTGIMPAHVPAFIATQILGGFTAAFVFGWLFADTKSEVELDAVMPAVVATKQTKEFQDRESFVKERELVH